MGLDKIAILDFGAQYTQLIARRIREMSVYSEILPCTQPAAEVLAGGYQGIVLSGGPSSVYDEGAPLPDKAILESGIPILGICYGMSDPNRWRFSTEEFYLKSADQMREVFRELPDAHRNTLAVAERCDLQLAFGKFHLPNYQLPVGFETLDAYLEHLAIDGLRARYGASPADSVAERLRYELSVISKMGFSGYFLVVWDFIAYARRHGIAVGPGRGSSAGSLVAYCLGITNVDPIRYGLLFERFLNPERISMPDMDIDFADDRRDEVIRYVVDRYGEDRVAHIITFGTMKSILEALRARVLKVVVNDLRDNTFFAVLHLQLGAAEITVDARPSDAIALALRVAAPIFVDEAVVTKAQMSESAKEPDAATTARGEDPDKVKEWLESIKPGDFMMFAPTQKFGP